MSDSLTAEELQTRFSYHRPHGTQQSRYEQLRERAREFAILIRDLCPDCRERSKAITELEDCVMWANASIARRESHEVMGATRAQDG